MVERGLEVKMVLINGMGGGTGRGESNRFVT